MAFGEVGGPDQEVQVGAARAKEESDTRRAPLSMMWSIVVYIDQKTGNLKSSFFLCFFLYKKRI
jgi:hypothetical protein